MANTIIGSMPYSLSKRKSNPSEKNSELKVFGSLQQRETVDLRTLAKHIREHGSSFSVGTLQGVLSDMVECTRELLKQGYSVNFEGLMRLFVTANSQGVDSAEEFMPNAHFTHINLRGDVDTEVENFLNDHPEFEYVMTRDEQAKAKRAAKAALVIETEGGGDNNGDGDDQTE